MSIDWPYLLAFGALLLIALSSATTLWLARVFANRDLDEPAPGRAWERCTARDTGVPPLPKQNLSAPPEYQMPDNFLRDYFEAQGPRGVLEYEKLTKMDRDAISGDWQRVGDDLRAVMPPHRPAETTKEFRARIIAPGMPATAGDSLRMATTKAIPMLPIDPEHDREAFALICASRDDALDKALTRDDSTQPTPALPKDEK